MEEEKQDQEKQSRRLATTILPRETGWIYYLKSNPLEIWRSPSGRKQNKKSQTAQPQESTHGETTAKESTPEESTSEESINQESTPQQMETRE